MNSSKTVVVTGASSGIGAALAVQLGAGGHRVVLAARRERELTQVARRSGPEALPVPTDVTRRGDVERLRDRALERFGQVDVWVNNAGRGIVRPVLELTDDEFDAMMAVNVKSALYGMQAIVPHFKERGRGHVINVSSFLGRVPIATIRSAYNAAKAALNSLTANLRMDLARSHPHLHVSLVLPGLVATEFPRNVLGSAASPGAQPAASGPAPQSADDVAAAIMALIEHPAPEVYTNPAQAPIVARYYQDVGAFEQATTGGGLPAGRSREPSPT